MSIPRESYFDQEYINPIEHYYMWAEENFCPQCAGTGYYGEEDWPIECGTCGGTGVSPFAPEYNGPSLPPI